MMPNYFAGGAAGSQFDDHNALYSYPWDMYGGTLTGDTGDPASVPRRTLAAAGTTGVETLFAIGARWQRVAVRWAWAKEALGAGNVMFRFRYSLLYPLIGGSATAASLTTIAIPAEAAPGDPAGTMKYSLPAATAAVATPPDGFFGTSPIMVCSLDRLGDDAGDTYAGAVGIFALTLTRVD